MKRSVIHRTLRLSLLTVALATAGLLALAPRALAIQNGQPDGANHPYVCLVVFSDQDDNPVWFATGALISPQVVLTAGHATLGTARARAWFLPDMQGGPAPLDDPNFYVGTPYTNPQYRWLVNSGDPGQDLVDYHDVGIVLLKKAPPVSRLAALPTPGVVETLPMGHLVDAVGWGMNYQAHGGGVNPYDAWVWLMTRYAAPLRMVQTSSVTSPEFIELTANPAQGKGGMTFGDSGGPVLDGGTDTILGVFSYVSNSNCSGVTYAQRVDVPEILDWIRGFMK
jgi:hypothetical protein